MTTKTILGDIGIADVSVPRGTTFGAAADLLVTTTSPMLAVLDDDRRVAGLFGADQALAGILPRYLDELHHTAFARDDATLLAARAASVRDEPVERHAVKPVTVPADASALHLGETFLHCGLPAVAVVERGRFLGMLDRAELARALLRRVGAAEA